MDYRESRADLIARLQAAAAQAHRDGCPVWGEILHRRALLLLDEAAEEDGEVD